MKTIEIVPKGGSSYIVIDGQEVSRHDSVKAAEQLRQELIRRHCQAQPERDREMEVER